MPVSRRSVAGRGPGLEKQANMRIDTLGYFAIQLHDHPQHTVRRGVLRPEIDRVICDDIAVSGGRFFDLDAHYSAC